LITEIITASTVIKGATQETFSGTLLCGYLYFGERRLVDPGRTVGGPQHPLLHDAPDLVVDGIQVWTVGQPEVRTNEVRRLSLQQLDGITGAMCFSAVLLEDKCVTCYLFDGWNHLLRQQDIAVVLAINFNSRVDKHQLSLSHTHFDTATDTITDLLNVERVRSRRLG